MDATCGWWNENSVQAASKHKAPSTLSVHNPYLPLYRKDAQFSKREEQKHKPVELQGVK